MKTKAELRRAILANAQDIDTILGETEMMTDKPEGADTMRPDDVSEEASMGGRGDPKAMHAYIKESAYPDCDMGTVDAVLDTMPELEGMPYADVVAKLEKDYNLERQFYKGLAEKRDAKGEDAPMSDDDKKMRMSNMMGEI